MLFSSQDRFHLASFKPPSAAKRTTSINAKMAPGVFIWMNFVIVIRSVQMGAMRVLIIAKMSVGHFTLSVCLSSHATTAVAYGGILLAAP